MNIILILLDVYLKKFVTGVICFYIIRCVLRKMSSRTPCRFKLLKLQCYFNRYLSIYSPRKGFKNCLYLLVLIIFVLLTDMWDNLFLFIFSCFISELIANVLFFFYFLGERAEREEYPTWVVLLTFKTWILLLL